MFGFPNGLGQSGLSHNIILYWPSSSCSSPSCHLSYPHHKDGILKHLLAAKLCKRKEKKKCLFIYLLLFLEGSCHCDFILSGLQVVHMKVENPYSA